MEIEQIVERLEEVLENQLEISEWTRDDNEENKFFCTFLSMVLDS